MSININTEETVDVVVNGTKHAVKIPSLKQFSKLEADLKNQEGTSNLVDTYSKFFANLGLPAASSDKFSLKNWKVLIEEMTGSKN